MIYARYQTKVRAILSFCEHSQVFSLSQGELDRGLVACSSGNFALALLHACAAICRPGRQEHLARDCSVFNLKQAPLLHPTKGSVSQACGCREVCLRTCTQLSGRVWTVAGRHYGRRSSWPQMQRPSKVQMLQDLGAQVRLFSGFQPTCRTRSHAQP